MRFNVIHSCLILDIQEATQTLDFIPLLAEDEALVAELASMEPVAFEHTSNHSLGMFEKFAVAISLHATFSMLT